MPPLIRILLVATCIAIVGVVLYEQFVLTGDDQSWEALAQAMKAQDPVPALETARDQASGGPAGPWIEYELALQLYDRGGSENFQRSHQVAQAALDAHPDHVTAPWLRRLIAAIDSYKQAAVPQ